MESLDSSLASRHTALHRDREELAILLSVDQLRIDIDGESADFQT
jgi:hypothetical protein